MTFGSKVLVTRRPDEGFANFGKSNFGLGEFSATQGENPVFCAAFVLPVGNANLDFGAQAIGWNFAQSDRATHAVRSTTIVRLRSMHLGDPCGRRR